MKMQKMLANRGSQRNLHDAYKSERDISNSKHQHTSSVPNLNIEAANMN